MTTLERIRAREPIALDPQTLAAAVTYLRANPQEQAVYVRWDNVCIGESAMLRKCGTRTGQLVSIATDGIPMRVSRGHRHVADELARDEKFRTRTGRLTPYALACGYVEEFKRNGHSLTLWQEGGCMGFHVRQHDHNAQTRVFWDCPRTLTEARKRFDTAKRAILAA